tara:strand:- start:402 stop:662 length:261 start_codon:yes stop_codon:yes gene_type:complete
MEIPDKYYVLSGMTGNFIILINHRHPGISAGNIRDLLNSIPLLTRLFSREIKYRRYRLKAGMTVRDKFYYQIKTICFLCGSVVANY